MHVRRRERARSPRSPARAEGDYTATLSAKDAFHPATTDTAAVKVRDVRFPFDYVVDATTHLKKLNQDVTVPTGTFKGVINLTTGALTGDITLPPAQTTLSLAGFGLVTANMQIVQRQSVTGTLEPVDVRGLGHRGVRHPRRERVPDARRRP